MWRDISSSGDQLRDRFYLESRLDRLLAITKEEGFHSDARENSARDSVINEIKHLKDVLESGSDISDDYIPGTIQKNALYSVEYLDKDAPGKFIAMFVDKPIYRESIADWYGVESGKYIEIDSESELAKTVLGKFPGIHSVVVKKGEVDVEVDPV